MRALLVLAAVLPLSGQVTSVYVGGEKVRLISGESMQLRAVGRDSSGNVVNTAASWSSNNSAVVSVDSNGNATADGLGFADISANIAGRVGVLRLQVLPQRIEVAPADAAIAAGSQQQFSAVAYNVQDQPIPNATFTWRLLVAGGGQDSTTATISPSGVVTGRVLGYYVVRASVQYPNTPSQFLREFAGSTNVSVIPADYSVTPLVSSGTMFPTYRLRGKRSTIAANDAGQIAFTASLDGLSSGVMQWANQAVRVFATSGATSVLSGTMFWDYENLAIDNQGRVLATATQIGSSTTMVLAGPDGAQVLVPDRSRADQGLDVTNITTNRFSLSDNGQAVLRANFRYDGSATFYQGIFRYAEGDLILEASSRDPLPSLNGSVGFDNDFGIDAKGVIYFAASAGSGRAVFRKGLFQKPTKVLAVGDPLDGSTVSSLGQLAVGQGGDLVVRAVLANGSVVLARYASGATAPALITASYVNQLSGVNSAGGVVWIGDAGPGYGVYLWTGASLRQVLRLYAPAPNGEPVADIYAASVDAAGNVYASVRGVETPWMLLRATGVPAVLAANGTSVAAAANVDLNSNPVAGARVGPLHVLTGGNQPSIFQADGRNFLPVLLLGDRLPGGSPYMGNFFPRKSPSGDLYVTTDNATVRMRTDGGSSVVAGYPRQLEDGATMFAPFNLAANDNGQIVVLGNTNQNHQRLVMIDSAGARTLAYFNGGGAFQTRSPDGGNFAGLNEFAINDAGQVMISASVNGGPGGLFLYDGTGWRSICPLGSCRLDEEVITGASTLRVSNNRFCALLTPSNAMTRIDCWEGTTPAGRLARRGERTSDGTESTSVNTFDINRKGDVAIVANTSLGGPNVFLKTSDGYYTVQSAPFPSEEGAFLVGAYSVDLRDDRRVFFIAQDYLGRMVAYAADPLF